MNLSGPTFPNVGIGLGELVGAQLATLSYSPKLKP